MDPQAVIAHTQRWLAEIVVGLNFCPFAARVFEAGLIRFVVSDAADAASLFEQLADELRQQASTAITEVETTLLIHPSTLLDFGDYNDFLGDADRLIAQLGLTGTIQIAGFHPQFQFADSGVDDVENYVSRSPYPMLHLLREASVTAVASDQDLLADIPRRNVALLRTIGLPAMLEKLKSLAQDPP